MDMVWDIRMYLLWYMFDWTAEQEMSLAIRIERATKQSLWWGFKLRRSVLSCVIIYIFRIP